MKPTEIVYLAIGAFIGVAVMFYQIDAPISDKCQTYKVASKSVTSYALKPPPPIVTPAVCPAAPACVSQAKVNDTQNELNVADDTQITTRRHRRHWRHYWRRRW